MEIRNVGVNATGSIGRHQHSDEGVFEFHYFLGGAGLFTNAGTSYPVRPGSLFYSLPADVHWADQDPTAGRMIIYNLSFRADDPEDAPLRHLLDKQFATSAHLSIGKGYGLLFEDLRRKVNSRDNLLRLSAHHRFLSFVYEILGGVVREHAVRGQLYVDEALHHMQVSLAGSLNLDELVSHLGIDKSYFIRLFKQVVGAPPLRYFLTMKMDAAKSSLREPGRSIRQVAFELGFDDEFYFSRLFKATTGQSPHHFRESHSKVLSSD